MPPRPHGSTPDRQSKATREKKKESPNSQLLYWVMAGGVAMLSLLALLLVSQQGRTRGNDLPTCEGEACKSRRLLLQTEHLQQRSVTVGNKTFHPSFGLFPKGCKWRSISFKGSDTGSESPKTEYQYWDFANKAWMDTMPEACSPQGHPAPGPPGFEFNKGTARTEVTCDENHCMYTNLFYNNGRFYALVDGPDFVQNWR